VENPQTPRHTREADQRHHMSVDVFDMQSDPWEWADRTIQRKNWHASRMHDITLFVATDY